MRLGFNCSGTSRTRSIVGRPCSALAQTSFTAVNQIEALLKPVDGIPWWSKEEFRLDKPCSAYQMLDMTSYIL